MTRYSKWKETCYCVGCQTDYCFTRIGDACPECGIVWGMFNQDTVAYRLVYNYPLWMFWKSPEKEYKTAKQSFGKQTVLDILKK